MHDIPADDPLNPYGYSMPDTNTGPIAIENHTLLMPGYGGSPSPGVVAETYYTSVWHAIPTGGGVWDHKYMYETILTNEWPEEEGVIYWLNIEAEMDDAWLPGPHHFGWVPGEYPELHPHHATWTNLDLAFELTTDEVGTNQWYQPIVITNMAAVSTNQQRLWSVGTWGSGTQILEKCVDLTASNWVGVATKPLPLPPPWTNVWTPPVTVDTQRNYRVIEKK